MLLLEHARTLLKELMLPPADLLLLSLLGLVLMGHRPRLGRALLLVGLLSLWLLCLPIVGDALTRLASRYPPLDLARSNGAQAVVILGGGGQRALAPEYGAPASGNVSLERLAYGSYVARKTGLPILVTGFHSEAIAMGDTLQRNFGLTPRWVDAQSYDTFQNARNSTRLLRAAGIERILLVTHATHEWRAVHEFSAAGLQVIPAPTGIPGPETTMPPVFRWVPDPLALQASYSALYELLGERVREFFAWTHLRRQ